MQMLFLTIGPGLSMYDLSKGCKMHTKEMTNENYSPLKGPRACSDHSILHVGKQFVISAFFCNAQKRISSVSSGLKT